MALYLVSYDVPVGNDKDYQNLWDTLDGLGAKKILYSQWAVRSNSATGLFDTLKALLRPNDGLVVQEITRDSFNYQNLRIEPGEISALLREAHTCR